MERSPRKKNKLTKPQAGYIEPPPKKLWPTTGKGIRCGTCIYYHKGGGCGIVDDPVHPQGCCNVWSHEGRPEVDEMVGGDAIKKILGW